jgi:glyoxylase-like metal-dependent hydrolase (beta-lactamase superfamily II)
MPLTSVRFINGGYCTQWSYLAGRPSWSLTRFHAVFVYLEHPQHGAALIDTGYSPFFFEASRYLPGRVYRWVTPVHLEPRRDPPRILEGHGIKPDQVNQVFVSHFHGDHIAGLRDFPQARFVYRRASHALLMDEGAWRQVRHGFLAKLLPRDFVARGRAIEETEFGPGKDALAEFRVLDYWGDGSLLLVDLPGHADGHTGYILRTATETWFYVVDACWDMEVMLHGRQLPKLSRGLQFDYSAYEVTQDKLRRVAALKKYPMLACHCPRTQEHVAKP